MTEKRFTVKTPDDLHKQVKVKAAQDGKEVSGVIRGLLAAWLQGAATPAPDPERLPLAES
jgi:plasmid stability protein